MRKQNKLWILLITAVILVTILSGCVGLTKTAKIDIIFDSNPVPYNSETKNWIFTLIFNETNGIGVTLNSLRVDEYNWKGELFFTQVFYEEKIINWFETDYLPAFSSFEKRLAYSITPGYEFAKYTILTVEGVDNNNNPIEAIGKVYFLPK